MEKLFETKRNKLIIAIILNLVILLSLILLGDIRYETNDDFSMSIQISQGWCYISFANYYLCKSISALYSIINVVNWFIVIQFLVAFITLVLLTYIYFDVNKVRLIHLIFVPALFFIGIDHYLSVQFTKTAALLLMVGILMIFHGVIIKRKKSWVFTGCIWLLIGSMFRFSNLRAAICFGIALLAANFIWFVLDASSNNEKRRELLFRSIAFFVIVVVTSGLCFGVSQISKYKNTETKELKSFREYSKYRAKVLDYPLPSYKDNKEKYKKINFSAIDKEMLKKQFLDTDNIASLYTLKQLSKLQIQDKETLGYSDAFINFARYVYNALLNCRRVFIHLVILLTMSILGFLCFEKRWFIFPVAIGAACFIAYIYLFHFGRTVYRAVYIIDIAGIILLFYSLRFAKLRNKIKETTFYQMIKYRKWGYAFIAIAVLIPMVYAFAIEAHWDDPEEGEIIYDSDKMYDYILDNKDKTFVMSSATSTGNFQKKLRSFRNPLRTPIRSERLLTFGGWSTMSPYKAKMLKVNKLKNLYSDIIDNDRVIAVINQCRFDDDGKPVIYNFIEQYFNDKYGKKGSRIKFNHYKEVGKFQLWQVERIKEKEKEK